MEEQVLHEGHFQITPDFQFPYQTYLKVIASSHDIANVMAVLDKKDIC